jgi:hypothetical protein
MLLQGAAADIKIVLQAGSDALNWQHGRALRFRAEIATTRPFILNLQNRRSFPPPGVSETLLAASESLWEDCIVSPASLPPASPATT